MKDFRRRAAPALVGWALLLFAAPGPAGAESASPGATVATADAYTIAEDGVLEVAAPGVLGNDSPGPATCVIGYDPSTLQGDFSGSVDGSFTFTPLEDWNGETSFTYGINATGGGGPACPDPPDSTATVTITVTPVNDPPTAVADGFTALANRTLSVAAPGVLGNDSDVEGDPLTAIKTSSPSHGVVTLAPDGGFSYSPAAGYVGPDAFAYRASDGTDQSLQRVVSLNVVAAPTPAPPTPVITPTAIPPTAAPDETPVDSPAASESSLPSESPIGGGPVASASSSTGPVNGPVASAGGPPILAIGALVLLIALLAIAGVYFVRSQGAGAEEADEIAGSGGERFDDDGPPPA